MAEDSYAFPIFVIIWLIIITAAIVVFGVGVFTHRIDFGPTGPVGPTGPPAKSETSVSSTFPGFVGTSMIPSSGMNIPSGTQTAQCFPCNFTNFGQISDYQSIPAGKPQAVRWVLSSNSLTTNYQDGTFQLPPGVYQLSIGSMTTSLVYPSTNSTGQSNLGGSYRSISVWLREASANNVVVESDLLGTTTVQVMTQNGPTVITFPQIQFQVTAMKNRMSIITWHNALTTLEIGALSRLNLMKIS